MIISFLLLGDHGTHKTLSVSSLGHTTSESPLPYLYSYEMSDFENPVDDLRHDNDDESNFELPSSVQKINIWDIPSTVRDLKKFVTLPKVNICMIFCHLNHTPTCEGVPSWYSIIQRLRPGIQVVLIAYMERETDRVDQNQKWLLNWCRNEIHQDLPYYRIQQDCEFPAIYRQLTEYMKEKMKNITHHGLSNGTKSDSED